MIVDRGSIFEHIVVQHCEHDGTALWGVVRTTMIVSERLAKLKGKQLGAGYDSGLRFYF